MFYLISEFYKQKKLALKSTQLLPWKCFISDFILSLSLSHSPTFWVLKLLDNYRFLGESDDCYQLFFH